jgi:hypothetical protein
VPKKAQLNSPPALPHSTRALLPGYPIPMSIRLAQRPAGSSPARILPSSGKGAATGMPTSISISSTISDHAAAQEWRSGKPQILLLCPGIDFLEILAAIIY